MRSRAALLLPCAVAVLLGGVAAVAERGAVATAQQGAAPPPPWARSVEVVDDRAVVRAEPREGGPRRGTVRAGTRLPYEGRVAGTGCATGTWARIGAAHYVCEANLRPSALAPEGTPQPVVPSGASLPHAYAFVGVDGTRAYGRPSDYEADDYIEALGEGFGLVVVGQTRWEGIPFARTRRGLFVEREALRFARGSEFAGVEIAPGGGLDAAWAVRDGVRLHASARGRVVATAPRRALLRVAEELRGGWARLADGTFARTRDLARATSAGRPEQVEAAERWIDVDVSQQVMVVWEGDSPLFATLVSTGRRGRATETPLGEHRVWVKLATSDMDDLERDDLESNYAIEAVPWVQYFEGSNGFHAAFWHDDFGRRRSHGCVNLSPRDARRLFELTEPALPPGWHAVLPVDGERGTLVRVRDGAPRPPPAP